MALGSLGELRNITLFKRRKKLFERLAFDRRGLACLAQPARRGGPIRHIEQIRANSAPNRGQVASGDPFSFGRRWFCSSCREARGGFRVNASLKPITQGTESSLPGRDCGCQSRQAIFLSVPTSIRFSGRKLLHRVACRVTHWMESEGGSRMITRPSSRS
jgi:hypothetical protein